MVSPGGVLQRAKASLPWRAWERYGKARGNILAGGIAYSGFFSLFPALAFGFTIFGIVLGNNPDLQTKVIKAVNDGMGTAVIKTSPTSSGIVDIGTLTGGHELTIVGIIGVAGLLITGLGWLDAMREGIRAMFGQPPAQGNFLVTKAKDLLVLGTLGVVILASAIAGFVINSATGALLRWIGLSGSVPGRLVLGALSAVLLLAVDVLMFVVLFQVLSGVQIPHRDLWDAALFGGIGLGLLKIFAGVLLNGASHNKFLLSAGLLLGLLVWLNLVSRLTLVAAAWGATVALDRGHLADGLGPGQTAIGQDPHQVEATRAGAVRAGAATAPRPEAALSTRAGDRVSVAAGAVLGAGALLAVRTATSAVQSLVKAARRSDD